VKHAAIAASIAVASLASLTVPAVADSFAQEPSAAPGAAATPAPEGRSAVSEAAYQFSVAKMLVEESAPIEASDAFAEAVRLAPADPYIRLEYARFLVQLAGRTGLPSMKQERLALAAEQAEKASELAPQNVEALRSLGQTLLILADGRPGGLEAAAKALEGVRRLAPFDLQAMIPLGQIYLEQNRPGAAADVFADAATFTPDNRIVYTLLANALQTAGRDREAADALRKLIALDPDSVDDRISLAKIQGRIGDHAGAVATLREAPAKAQTGFGVASELAWHLYRSGRLEEALEAVTVSLTERPGDRWMLLVRALVLGGLGRTDEALEQLADLRRDDPNNFELVRASASLLEQAGRTDEAVAMFKQALGALPPDRPDLAARARLTLAGLYSRAGEPEEALSVLSPTLEVADPELRRDGFLSTAEVLEELGRDDEAIALLRRGEAPELRVKEIDLLLRDGRAADAEAVVARLEEAGATTEIRLMVAQVAQRHESYALSIPLLRRVVEERADSVNAHFLLGAGLERTGQHEAAAAAFRQLLAIDPDFAPALNYLGYMWVERGENLGEAVSLVERAVELDPDNGAYIDSLGWAHYRLGELDLAREYLERASRLVPDDSTVWEHLADVYAALGDHGRARQLYRRALELAGAASEDSLRQKLEDLGIH